MLIIYSYIYIYISTTLNALHVAFLLVDLFVFLSFSAPSCPYKEKINPRECLNMDISISYTHTYKYVCLCRACLCACVQKNQVGHTLSEAFLATTSLTRI